MYLHSEKCIVIVLCALILVFPTVSALTVSPQTQTLSDPSDEVYQFVYSITNNDPQPRAIQLRYDPYSTYLEEKAHLSKEQFALLPGQTENIQLSIHPQGLGPQTHTLRLGVYDGESQLTTFELLIAVVGDPQEQYETRIVAGDTTTKSAVPISITLINHGNIIGMAKLRLTVEQNNQSVDTIDYPDAIQVLPGKTVPYDLVYSNSLQPGFYTMRVDAVYPSQESSATDQFSVRLEELRRRVHEGEDLILQFESMGNPTVVTYQLVDDAGGERLAGSATPQAGDLVLQTSELPAGTYTLILKGSHGEQRTEVIIEEEPAYLSVVLGIVAALILLYALYSYGPVLRLRWRVYKLERKIASRQEEVTNLINRAHRLVDNYSTVHARRHQASRSSGTTTTRP